MDPIASYLKELNRKSQGYRPTWLPNLPLQLGNVGVLEKEVFRKEATLESLGIAFESETSESNSNIDLSSESGITVITKVEGKVEPKAVSLGVADAGFIVEFNNKNCFVFRIRGSRTSIIQNLADVKAEVLRRYDANDWDPNLVIISEIIEAKSATILLSGQAGAKIELKAQGDLNVATMDIADAGLNLRLESGQSLAAQIIGQKGITPLYRVVGIKKRLFSSGFAGREPGDEPQTKKDDIEVAEIEMESLPEE
ncbi:MAG TPA: hypothetical protein VK897_13530 [Anaerolineales bacterium]|nr:hypothetical protein [Anaerolineales bacterium]